MTNSRHYSTAPLPVDWRAVQADYEQGIKSVPQLSKQYGIKDTTITVRASREGWLRDPLARARITAERDAILAKELELKRERIHAITAHQQAEVLVRHRTSLQKARAVVDMLLDEVCSVSANPQLFEELGEILRSPDDRGRDKLNDAYKRVISVSERSQTINTLATALRTLILMERQAFSIEGKIEDPEAQKPQEEVVKGLDAIMSKFDAVLALQAPAAPMETVEVVTKEVPHGVPVQA